MVVVNYKELYYKKLKDPRWQEKRLLIFKRDNFTCLICKSNTDSLELHHEAYYKDPWDAPNDKLKTLCFRCHEVIELCKKNKIKYRNINRVQRGLEKFVYVINTKVDAFGNNGKYTFIIHNLNYNSDGFHLVAFCFSKDFIDYIIDTF